MIVWHMLTKEADYIWSRPARMSRAFRAVELRAGHPAKHAKRGEAHRTMSREMYSGPLSRRMAFG